jgi:hypothetical protein
MVATVASAFVSYGQWTVLAKTDTAVHDALPRGWIFVETKDSGTDTGLAASGGNVSVRFALKNYGTTPALIRDIEAELAVPESGVGNYDLSVDPFEVSQGFVRKEARLFENDLIGRVLTPGEGVSPSHPMWFDFTTLAQVAGRPIREAPKWLRVRVRYVDPNGVNRETSGVYTLSLAGPGTMLLATSKYTYWH